MILEHAKLHHWNYFLALESDLERLARFVEFTADNFKTYSIEIAHLLLATSSEVDVVAKQLCLNRGHRAESIDQYRLILCRDNPEISNTVVTIPRYGLELRPWINWSSDKTPDWWRDHNKVKHQRGENFNLANLGNALNALSGLFLMVLYYYLSKRAIEPPPTLFMPPAHLATICAVMGGGVQLCYK